MQLSFVCFFTLRPAPPAPRPRRHSASQAVHLNLAPLAASNFLNFEPKQISSLVQQQIGSLFRVTADVVESLETSKFENATPSVGDPFATNRTE